MILAWEFVGALGILIPLALYQAGRLSQHAPAYLVLNLLGAGVLTGVAVAEAQWGFAIINGAWTIASVRGLCRAR